MNAFQVWTEDNFHYADHGARRMQGEYRSELEAVRAACELIDRSLQEQHAAGMSAAELIVRFRSFGEDAYLVKLGFDARLNFSGWDYAEAAAERLCAQEVEGA